MLGAVKFYAVVRVALLFAAGTNCDQETALAFRHAGGSVSYLHINELKVRPEQLRRFQILVIPGGFTYGDYVAAGVILANELRFSLRAELLRFVNDGKLILGVCNGFQVLVRAGILPGNEGYFARQRVTLATNDSLRFECRWVWLQPQSEKCVFLKGIRERIMLPVAHAEGKLVADSTATLRNLVAHRQVVFTYVAPDSSYEAAVLTRVPGRSERRARTNYPWNPNGSELDIAGICDPTGRILGLMPHPERFIRRTQHPAWTRNPGKSKVAEGLRLYQNAVDYVRSNL